MRIGSADLSELEGGGGAAFQNCLFSLVVRECKTHNIPAHNVHFDSRVNIGDGGRDIFVEASHPDPNPSFIPKKPSIWSAKSGADGIKGYTLKKESGLLPVSKTPS